MIKSKTLSHSTSIASWSIAIGRTLELYGHNANDVFKKADIDLEGIESPHSRLAVDCVQKVWEFAYQNTDESFGVKVSQFLGPASFHALGFGLYSSSTLKELLERLIRYRCVVSHMFFAELVEHEDGYLFTTADKRAVKTNVTNDALYGYILSLARDLSPVEHRPQLVMLTRNPTGPTEKLSDLMQAPIKFGEMKSGIVFSKHQLEQPLRYGNPSLATKQDSLVEQYIAELGLISEYMLRVKSEICRLLESGEISVNLVAENLNVTVRTLQRRLADENSSYHNLLDQVRYRLAMDYIASPGISVTEIAFKLGFNDSGNFSRNFKRWTKLSFSEYRNRLFSQ